MDFPDWLLVNGVHRPNALSDEQEQKGMYWPAVRMDSANRPTQEIPSPRHLFQMFTAKALRSSGVSEEEIEQRCVEYCRGYQGVGG